MKGHGCSVVSTCYPLSKGKSRKNYKQEERSKVTIRGPEIVAGDWRQEDRLQEILYLSSYISRTG